MSTFLNLPNPFAYNISLYSLPIVRLASLCS
jgi:hypothetical protein